MHRIRSPKLCVSLARLIVYANSTAPSLDRLIREENCGIYCVSNRHKQDSSRQHLDTARQTPLKKVGEVCRSS